MGNGWCWGEVGIGVPERDKHFHMHAFLHFNKLSESVQQGVRERFHAGFAAGFPALLIINRLEHFGIPAPSHICDTHAHTHARTHAHPHTQPNTACFHVNSPGGGSGAVPLKRSSLLLITN